MPKQNRFVVPKQVVMDLVGDFLASGNGRFGRFCHEFRPAEMREELCKCNEIIPSYFDYNEVSNVISDFECRKLSALCNTWTSWMRHRIRYTKLKIDAALKNETGQDSPSIESIKKMHPFITPHQLKIIKMLEAIDKSDASV